MDKKIILEKLEVLYNIKEVTDGFPSQKACIEWANKVAPLLKFNGQYYVNFIQNSHKMNLPLSSYTLGPAFNIMVSQMQMAIEELKLEIEQKNEPKNLQDKPKKVKRKPFYKHWWFVLFLAPLGVIFISNILFKTSITIPTTEKPDIGNIKIAERYAYEFDYYQDSSNEAGNNSRIIEDNAILRQKYNADNNVRITLGIANFNKGIPIEDAGLQVLFDKGVVVHDHYRWVVQEVNSRYSFSFEQNINNTPLNADSIFVHFINPGKHSIRVLIDGAYLPRKEVTYFIELYQ